MGFGVEGSRALQTSLVSSGSDTKLQLIWTTAYDALATQLPVEQKPTLLGTPQQISVLNGIMMMMIIIIIISIIMLLSDPSKTRALANKNDSLNAGHPQPYLEHWG